MPDDIIVSILSKITLKEAASTSNLSKRWRYLWCQIDSLDFDANEKLDKIALDYKLKIVERPKYINWVNRVTRQYKGPSVNEFRVCFDFDKTSKIAIDRWVEFAVGKRVKKLELDVLENGEMLRQPARNYVFPIKIFDRSVKRHMEMKFLKALFLKCVNVSEEALARLLVSCSGLEQLSIHGSGELVNVKINGKSLVLKYFEIVFCSGVKSIEITDSNLESFSYLGPGITIKFSELPRLKEISIGEGYSGFENNVFGQISCCISHLQILTLDIYRPEENLKFSSFPELPKLKQLILKVGAWEDDSLLEFTTLAKACPKLQRFVIQIVVFLLIKLGPGRQAASLGLFSQWLGIGSQSQYAFYLSYIIYENNYERRAVRGPELPEVPCPIFAPLPSSSWSPPASGHLVHVAIPASRGESVEFFYASNPDSSHHFIGTSQGAGTAILTLLGGFHPQTQSLWLTDMAHHHLAIAFIFLIAGHMYRTLTLRQAFEQNIHTFLLVVNEMLDNNAKSRHLRCNTMP
ncbi:FBD-like protein [Tanacetum coccineum]